VLEKQATSSLFAGKETRILKHEATIRRRRRNQIVSWQQRENKEFHKVVLFLDNSLKRANKSMLVLV